MCECLRIKRTQSYYLLRSAAKADNAYVTAEDVLAIVNYGRRNLPAFTAIPSAGELHTAEEISSGMGIRPHDLVLWTHRKRDPLPHIHLSNKTLRFLSAPVEEWLRRKFGTLSMSRASA